MKWLGLVRANLGRNKLRTALTGAAITLAVALVCMLLTMPEGLNSLLDNLTNNTRISVHNKAGVVYSMPYAFTRKVRQVDGVAAAVAMTWYGGAYEEAGRVTFPNFAVEADQVGAVYPDYPIRPEQLADFQRYRDGAIVGRQVMTKYHWKIGDRITLKSTVWPADLDLRIVGEIANDRAPMLWLNREYLDQALKAQGRPGLGVTGMIWVRAASPEQVNAIMRTVDELSRNSDAETASETEKSFFSNFFGSLQGFVTIVLIVTGLVALCIVFIAANTASMAVRERSGELAVMKAIGFTRGIIFGTLLAEAVVLSTIAGLLGVALTMGLTGMLRAFAGWNETLGPLGSFVVTAPVIVQGVFLSLFVGMLSGVVPSWGAARKPVVQTLHEIF
ncbi:MAG TPA: ABC transporter permease [Candidatus Dormibacteraeota bacterium]|nr:ABC transporter permease [Candidatus Dormibacteraeota bacterium]